MPAVNLLYPFFLLPSCNDIAQCRFSTEASFFGSQVIHGKYFGHLVEDRVVYSISLAFLLG
jgi:hypothetical protein